MSCRKTAGGKRRQTTWTGTHRCTTQSWQTGNAQNTSCPFTVNPCDLEIYTETEGKKTVEPGKYLVYAGGSCLDEQVSAEIEL